MTDTPTSWIVAFGTLLTGSGGKLIYDIYKVYSGRIPPSLKPLTVTDANLTQVIKARDEVIEDNVRLRQERVEQDARHAAERAVWLADQTRLREDIARLESLLRAEKDASAARERESQARIDALLQQVHDLGARANELRGER